MIRATLSAFRSHRQERAYNRIEAIQKKAAKLDGDALYHKRMADFYDAQVQKIDPHVDWHGFASVKEKWKNHCDEHKSTTLAMLETEAEHDAQLARYEKGNY